MAAAKKTTLDSDVTKPSTTAPGDGPADTTDPSSRSGEEARKVETVNAVVPGPDRPASSSRSGKDRIEKYEAVRPDGETVTVTRNIETGESTVGK